MTKFQKVIIVIVVVYLAIAALGKFTKGDIDGAEANAHRYCKMVYEGQWPDYQQNYLQFCDKDRWNGK